MSPLVVVVIALRPVDHFSFRFLYLHAKGLFHSPHHHGPIAPSRGQFLPKLIPRHGANDVFLRRLRRHATIRSTIRQSRLRVPQTVLARASEDIPNKYRAVLVSRDGQRVCSGKGGADPVVCILELSGSVSNQYYQFSLRAQHTPGSRNACRSLPSRLSMRRSVESSVLTRYESLALATVTEVTGSERFVSVDILCE